MLTKLACSCKCARCAWFSWCKKRKEAGSGEECERLLSNVIDEDASPLSNDQIETYLERKTRVPRSARKWRRQGNDWQRTRLERVDEDSVEVSPFPAHPNSEVERIEDDVAKSFVDKPAVRAEFDMHPQPGMQIADDFFDELEPEEIQHMLTHRKPTLSNDYAY
eukprot:GEMP01051138.1.p2 GENE.GEMP01051138.1~~GEMP01051138.1.p2  ORF type:complete len:164 (+),score=30.40 GEMP01051138.1:227-718(+)